MRPSLFWVALQAMNEDYAIDCEFRRKYVEHICSRVSYSTIALTGLAKDENLIAWMMGLSAGLPS
jgi:hypothetical protein